MAALNEDANNRQLHPTEAQLIKDNAKRFAQTLYGSDNPTSVQIDAAQERLTSTTLNQIDSAFGKRITTDDPQAQAFLKDLAAMSCNVDVGDGKLFDARGTAAFSNIFTTIVVYIVIFSPMFPIIKCIKSFFPLK